MRSRLAFWLRRLADQLDPRVTRVRLSSNLPPTEQIGGEGRYSVFHLRYGVAERLYDGDSGRIARDVYAINAPAIVDGELFMIDRVQGQRGYVDRRP